MAVSAIHPDGVLAMSAATLATSVVVAETGDDIQHEIDAVDHLVGWRLGVRDRTAGIAGDLAQISGWARERVLQYVDHDKPIDELLRMGFWMPDWGNLSWDPTKTAGENLEGTARSDEFGSFVLGTGAALLDRYRRFAVYVPRHGVPLPSMEAPRPDDVVHRLPLVRHPSGLLVIQGSAVDPGVERLARLADGPAFHAPNTPTFVTDPHLGRPPTWARAAGGTLSVAGTALTLYDSYATQWEHDATYHPDWSTGQRVANAGYSAAFEGGGAAAGGYFGAQLGAAVGSFVPIPIVGTVGGALIGGAIGAFVGSKAGKAAGRGLKEAVGWASDGVKDAWNSLFG